MPHTGPSGGPLSAAGMLEEVFESAPSLSSQFKDLTDPIRREREAIRDYWMLHQSIYPAPTTPPVVTVGATDGACVVEPWSVGDQITTLAVAVDTNQAGEAHICGHRSWSAFRAHSDDASVLATAMMMAHELTLISTIAEESVAIIDGSHVTPFVAINLALASPEATVRQSMIETVQRENLVEAAGQVCDNQMVVACPKSDTSTTLWDQCVQDLGLVGAPLPDKVLASLVLEPGEVLSREGATPSWERFYSSQASIEDPAAREVAESLAAAVSRLQQPHVKVYHVKPRGNPLALRMEVKPWVDDFEADDLINAVIGDCAPPHLLEPTCQHLADVLAKQVSSLSTAQLAQARNDLIRNGDEQFMEYLLRHYRTSM